MINELDEWKEYIREELLLKEVWKDGIWLQNQLIKGRITENDLLYIGLQSELLEEIYPNEWSYDIEVFLNTTTDNLQLLKRMSGKMFKFQFKPVIHFTNFKIVNTIGQSLPINDIYVKLNTLIDYVSYTNNIPYYIKRIHGVRTTVSYNEYTNNYAHSHLPRFNFKSTKLIFNKFCQGDGEINMVMTKLSQGFNPNLFRTLLFHLKGYLEWESLEGGPHIKIENLHIINKNEGLVYLDNKSVNHFGNNIIKIRKMETKPNLTWRINNNKLSLVDNQLLEDYCLLNKNRILEKVNKFLNDDVVYKDSKESYYPTSATQKSITLLENNYIIFKGEKKYLKVEGILDTTDKKLFIHPQIKKYVKSKLEYEANRNFIRSNTIERIKDKSNNAFTIHV